MELQSMNQATTEGWVISECSGVDEKWRLESCDDAGIFSNDLDVWLHVAQRALDGSTYHMNALKFLEVNELGEFAVIENHACLHLRVKSLTDLFVPA